MVAYLFVSLFTNFFNSTCFYAERAGNSRGGPASLLGLRSFLTLVKVPDKCPSIPIKEFPTTSQALNPTVILLFSIVV